jgi:competence protein ComEC
MIQKVIFSSVFVLISLLGLFVYDSIRFQHKYLKVVFCDVGQGDATYIRTPEGNDILIDAGPDNSVLLCLSENMPFWDKSLDLVILTHPDSDHYSGLIPVAREYEISSFATSFTPEDADGYKTLRSILAEKKVETRFVCGGDSYSFSDEVSFEILWPRSCTIASTDKNDNSVVTLLKYKDFKTLITGDAEASVGRFYQDMVGDVDILRVPHHGSRDGVDKDYLDATTPEIAVISSGAGNRFGHPVEEILNLLESESIQTLRTDETGDIRISSDGTTYSIDMGRN